MTKNFQWLTIILLASALALPASAYAQINGAKAGSGKAQHSAAPRSGGGGHPAARSIAPHFSGRAATPHFSGRAATPHFNRRAAVPHFSGRAATRHFNRHVATPHFNRQTGTPHISGRSLNRSVQRTQRTTPRNFTNRNLTNRNITGSTSANTNLRTRANANLHTRALRRNGLAGITPQAARQGRFSSNFVGRTHHRGAHLAAHRAWRRGLRAGFVSWYGPVFWPYAYSDIFDYAFWPDGYDDGYWFYAYDDFFDGVFWGEFGPPEDYAYAAPGVQSRVSYAAVQELCKQPGTGITAWPFATIERKVGLNDEQKTLLGDVRRAAADAAATFKASCPAEKLFPLTPPGRLQAMTARLQGTLDAVKLVRPALDKFYASLSDEQKERFNQLGPKRPANNAETTAALPQDSKSCTEAKPGLANLPIEKIEDVVKPTEAQQDGLKQLQEATGKAVAVLQAACPEDMPLTPPGRLEAMEKRLQAMVEAANTVKPALESFYASLSNEQKARFDRIGQQLAQSNG
jgi:hypothetical protein